MSTTRYRSAVGVYDGYLPGFAAGGASPYGGSLLARQWFEVGRGIRYVDVQLQVTLRGDVGQTTSASGGYVGEVRVQCTGASDQSFLLNAGSNVISATFEVTELNTVEVRVDGHVLDSAEPGWYLMLADLFIEEQLYDGSALAAYALSADIIYSGGAVAILDNDNVVGASVNLVVADKLIVDNVRVRVVVTHAALSQLRVTLEAPDGTVVQLTDGGLPDADEWYSDGPIGTDSGPGAAFRGFRGKQASGTWKIHCYDKVARTTGTIDNNCRIQVT
mgnify:CR=1 FL=1